jgi:flagellar export protein FliJ
MKQFHFSLETVLRLRAEQFEQTRQAFAECQQWRARAASSVASAQAEIDNCHDALTSRREVRTTRTDQLLFLNALQYQQSLLLRLKEELGRVERELEIRRATMLAAQRKLDALEHLREKQIAEHRAAEQRKENAELDDLITARYIMQTAEVAT